MQLNFNKKSVKVRESENVTGPQDANPDLFFFVAVSLLADVVHQNLEEIWRANNSSMLRFRQLNDT